VIEAGKDRNPQLIQEKSKEQKGFHSAKGPESANSCPEVPITKVSLSFSNSFYSTHIL
jgi:hypothetical protein